jgi:hypothetical protein
MNLIKQWQANTSASIVDNTSFTPNFDTYFITLEGIFPSSVTTSPLLFQFFTSSASTAQITLYLSASTLNNAGTVTGLVNTTGIQIGSTLQAAAQPGINGWVYVMDPFQTTTNKMVWAQTGGQSVTPTAQSVVASGYWNGGTTTTTSAFRIIFGSTAAVVNISSGIVRVYGINTA